MSNALIVLNYNDQKTTCDFLDMLNNNNAIDKIVVVDNSSSDNSFEHLKHYASERIDVIKTEKNGGYAYGNNYGCRYAIEKYSPDVLFISNPDVSFSKETVSEMEKVLLQDKSIAIVAPIVNQGYNVWNLLGYFGLIESIFLLIFNIDKRRIKKKLLNSNSLVEKVGVVEGSFFAISAHAFDKVDGFDERTFLYCEENIIAKRLRKYNYNTVVLTKERYNHYHSLSIKKQYGTKTKAYSNFYRSMKIYLDYYLNANRLQMYLFEICYRIGYLERVVYDIVIYFKNR